MIAPPKVDDDDLHGDSKLFGSGGGGWRKDRNASRYNPLGNAPEEDSGFTAMAPTPMAAQQKQPLVKQGLF